MTKDEHNPPHTHTCMHTHLPFIWMDRCRNIQPRINRAKGAQDNRSLGRKQSRHSLERVVIKNARTLPRSPSEGGWCPPLEFRWGLGQRGCESLPGMWAAESPGKDSSAHLASSLAWDRGQKKGRNTLQKRNLWNIFHFKENTTFSF